MFQTLLLGFIGALVSYFAAASIIRGKPPSRVDSKSYQKPRWFPHRDLLGIDLLYLTAKLMVTHEIIPAFARWHTQYGETFVVNSLRTPVVHTLSTRNIEVIFATDFDIWGVGPARLDAMQPLCGYGFINTDGDSWRRSRAMIAPAFRQSNTSGLEAFSLIVEDALTRIPLDGSTFDASTIMDELFLDAAGQFLLGERLGILSNNNSKQQTVRAREFIRSLRASQFWIGLRVIFGPIASYRFNPIWQRHRKVIFEFLDVYIDRALRSSTSNWQESLFEYGGSDNEQRTESLLATLLSQTRDRQQIRSHIIQATLALQNKTSTLVSNALLLLSRHPETWYRLKQELGGLSKKSTSAQDLRRIPYLQNVLKETLRLYPVFGQLGRTALRDTTLPSGGGPDGTGPILARAGTRTLSSWYGLHRDATVFGGDVDSFIPDRWDHIRPGPWEYWAFGSGPRNCMGQDKVLNEASFVLWAILSKADRIESRDSRAWTGEWKLTVKNLYGCKIALFATAEASGDRPDA